jgi:hypothetical protein
MVNQVLADYLRRYKGEYSMESLKNQILSKGYSEKDFNEANDSLTNPPGALFSTLDSLPESRPKRFKWMLFGGIAGLITLLTYSVIIVFGLLDIRVDFWGNVYLALGLIFVFLMLVFFYLFSFIRLSEYVESGLLKFAAISKIIIFIISIIGVAVFWILLYPALNAVSSFGGSAGSFSGGDFSVMTGNEVIELGSGSDPGALNINAFSYATTAWIIFFVFLIFILFALIVMFCFSIALIKLNTKFSGLAGVADLITSSISAATIFFWIYAIAQPYPAIGFYSQHIIAIEIFLGSILGFSLLALFFESVCLISASRKFE